MQALTFDVQRELGALAHRTEEDKEGNHGDDRQIGADNRHPDDDLVEPPLALLRRRFRQDVMFQER